ncbi:MAG: hypothetical protein K9J30_01865 [Bacteroidales bacterium]|nr:hypothetical protein [Bacteroidales bacterium]
MNRRIHRSLLVLTAIAMLFTSAAVNAQPDEKMKRFQEERISYFNEKLELTDKEAESFWPLYEDLQNRMMKNMEDEKALLNYYLNNLGALSDEEVNKTISGYMDLQDQRHNLRKKYHDSFVKIIGKKKTMKMYALEREFRMHILRKFRSGRGDRSGRHEDR